MHSHQQRLLRRKMLKGGKASTRLNDYWPPTLHTVEISSCPPSFLLQTRVSSHLPLPSLPPLMTLSFLCQPLKHSCEYGTLVATHSPRSDSSPIFLRQGEQCSEELMWSDQRCVICHMILTSQASGSHKLRNFDCKASRLSPQSL